MKTLLLFVLFWTTLIHSKTIIVSDIDDTLKNAHIRDSIDKYLFAFRTKNLFKGMPQALKLIQEETAGEIFYVTNAPKSLMRRSHTKFLKRNNLPKGQVFFRDEYSGNTHKIKTITKLINQTLADEVILIGDNGEHDPDFYNEIEKSFPQVSFKIFIRAAYPVNFDYPQQIFFTSPFEIIFELTSDEILRVESAAQFIKTVGEDFLKENSSSRSGAWYFPSWVDCNGHAFELPMILSDDQTAQTIVSNINFRCSN